MSTTFEECDYFYSIVITLYYEAVHIIVAGRAACRTFNRNHLHHRALPSLSTAASALACRDTGRVDDHWCVSTRQSRQEDETTPQLRTQAAQCYSRRGLSRPIEVKCLDESQLVVSRPRPKAN
ncbi:Hypothetical protein SMAX5B_007790 [Scophthalmus maximus]|uniref:Uncharacterized protein n=1 Tax=Scophthalmus maximus TaxID=52904 RepID=A0A2U9B2F5_SCOMX|nr:Hypothetical protein SMAX5B_007790 [Scophthalmus maximus]KAF0029780.1 hypothetical protein F2P81_018885 [Scophthalmus maximus]